jgi:hypothetical protein
MAEDSRDSFSFSLRPVLTHEDLLRACQVRSLAYGHKVPEYRESMAQPDEIDRSPWTGVYLCEDKVSGDAIGTMRVQTTNRGDSRLEIEKYVSPPTRYAGLPRAEITRLASVPGADPFVRLALWKAGYVHCKENGVRLLMIAVRKPGLIKAYERMGAKDISAPQPIPYGGNLPHRIMAVDILEAEIFWRESRHPMLQFMAETVHPDIKTFGLMNRNVGEASHIGLR